MKKYCLSALALFPLILSSCLPSTSSNPMTSSDYSDNESSINDSSDESSFSIISSIGEETLPSIDFTEFFAYETPIKFRFYLSDEALFGISRYGAGYDQQYADVYFPTDLILEINGESYQIPEVGLRMKGNLSRREFASNDGEIYSPSHFKVSFKETFDDYCYTLDIFNEFVHSWDDDALREARKDRTIASLEKVDLKYLPRNDGQAYGEEIYIYDTFREYGLLAPYAKEVVVELNTSKDNYEYRYEMIETVDKEFLKRRYDGDENDGDLYKCGWGSPKGNNESRGATLELDRAVAISYDENGYPNGRRLPYGAIGVEDNYNFYHPTYDLKTNDDGEDSDFSLLANYMNAVEALAHHQAPQELLESIIDVDYFLKFEAISYLFGNFDDQRNNYNNYYMYFLPSNGKVYYIAYDWDWGFDLGNRGAMNYELFRPLDLNNEPLKNNLYFVTFLDNENVHTIYDKSEYQARYEEYVKEYAADVLNYEKFASFMETNNSPLGTNAEQIRNYMENKLALIERS